MSQVFRAKYAEGLRANKLDAPKLYKSLFARPWVVYCKQPFFGPRQVVEYLGRYTHKIAISNHRIRSIENGQLTFAAKDYRHGGAKYLLCLTEEEFIRRFSLHILPRGFTRIRHYGILSSTLKKVCVELLCLRYSEWIKVSSENLGTASKSNPQTGKQERKNSQNQKARPVMVKLNSLLSIGKPIRLVSVINPGSVCGRTRFTSTPRSNSALRAARTPNC